MKKIKYILMLMLINTILYSQNEIDPPSILPILNYPPSVYSFNQDVFLRGWNWNSDGRKLDSALKMNTLHCNSEFLYKYGDEIRKYKVPQNTNWILAVSDIASGHWHKSITQAQAIQYEPSIYDFDTTNNYIHPMGDNCGTIFGFLYNNRIFQYGQYLQGNLVLAKETLEANNLDSALVLADPWRNDELFNQSEVTKDDLTINCCSPEITIKKEAMNGTRWYVSLRIRGLNKVQDWHNFSDTILKIKLPYIAKKRNSTEAIETITNYIKFDSVPDPLNSFSARVNIQDSRTPSGYRGGAKRLIANTNPDKTVFAITRGMLKSSYPADNDWEYLTLSAYFVADIDSNLPNFSLQNTENKAVSPYKEDEKFRIMSLNMEVKYFGKMNVAIDWIRIETPQYRELVRGRYDKLITDIYKKTIDSLIYYRPDSKIYRFCGIDEFRVSNYLSQRYLNKLLGGYLTGEVGEPDINRFLIATDFKEYWGGSLSFTPAPNCAMPYIHRTDFRNGDIQNNFSDALRMGLLNGKRGLTDWRREQDEWRNIFSRDTLNSCWETSIQRLPQNETVNVFNLARQEPFYDLDWSMDSNAIRYIQSSGFLTSIEKNLVTKYFRHKVLLYGNKSFISNIWASSDFQIAVSNEYPDGYLSFHGAPFTGEIARFNYWINIILGCKGFLTYSGSSGFSDNVGNVGTLALSTLYKNNSLEVQSNLPTGDAIVYSETLGGDYLTNYTNFKFSSIGENNTNTPIQSMLGYTRTTQESRDSMRISLDKIYVGTRSKRIELMKINKIIERLEYNKQNNPAVYPHDLMDLRLVAWYGKGFTKMYSQHPGYPETYAMSDFIDTAWVRTAKLYQPNTATNGQPANNFRNVFSNNTVNTWENKDSSFFDITVLTPKNTSINNRRVWYLGVQNRRTDPLIWDVSNPNNPQLKFSLLPNLKIMLIAITLLLVQNLKITFGSALAVG